MTESTSKDGQRRGRSVATQHCTEEPLQDHFKHRERLHITTKVVSLAKESGPTRSSAYKAQVNICNKFSYTIHIGERSTKKCFQ